MGTARLGRKAADATTTVSIVHHRQRAREHADILQFCAFPQRFGHARWRAGGHQHPHDLRVPPSMPLFRQHEGPSHIASARLVHECAKSSFLGSRPPQLCPIHLATLPAEEAAGTFHSFQLTIPALLPLLPRIRSSHARAKQARTVCDSRRRNERH